MKSEDFPEIILCPEPSFDAGAAKLRGYNGMEYYLYGIEDFYNYKAMGWAGKNESEGVRKVSEELSVLKSADDCPDKYTNYIWFEDGTGRNLEFKLVKALYPYYMCCKIITPNVTKTIIPQGILLYHSTPFKIFMADKLTASMFDQNNMKTFGDELIAKDKGINNYRVKILEKLKIEDDPNSFCIDYKVEGEFGKCLANCETEFRIPKLYSTMADR